MKIFCLHKLQYSIRFNVVERYSNLFYFYRGIGFDDEAQWVAGRLRWIVGEKAAQAITEQKEAH